jgi:hypothetical protein
LEPYRFSGYHKSHIGALKSCLEYLDIPCSAAWVFGMTGAAFMTIVDDNLSAPNIGEPEEDMFQLARHIGLEIRGFHTFANKAEFDRLQREAWDTARFALDQGLPVFAKELDLGNETSLVYAYSDEGYYTHSWHAGNGHEGFDDVILWTELGRNYCPCISCKARKLNNVWSNEGVYIGDPLEGGFISLHWASSILPSDDHIALQAALTYVLQFSRLETYEWGGRKFHIGTAAYNRWIEALQKDTILGFYMGYFAEICHESRHYAYLFLKEASLRFDGALSEAIFTAADHYKFTKEAFLSLSNLFPWSQPHTPIEDPDRRREAVELITQIKHLEIEGSNKLEKLLDLLRETK